MAADDFSHQTLMGEVVHALSLAIALSGGIDQGDVLRVRLGHKPLLYGAGQFLRVTVAHKAAAGNGGAVLNLGHRCQRGHYFRLHLHSSLSFILKMIPQSQSRIRPKKNKKEW